MQMKDIAFLLLTGLLSAYLCWYFYQRYTSNKALHNLYYLMGFAVLLISGLLLIFLGLDILASPYVLTVASLIPLGVSMGVAEEYYPSWKKAFKWFAVIGFLAIAITSIGGMLIGLGGIALAFISLDRQLLFFSPAFVSLILTPLLFLMTGAFTLGFAKKG